MTSANGLRLLLAARKSRKGKDGTEDYERQDHRAKVWSEDAGHVVIHVTKDTVSSQTAPWKRRSLGPWMTQADRLSQYDAILISDTDRISRGTDEDFHYIEDWCYRTGKSIIVANGPQFPPREGPMGESDRYQWIAQKRAARTYWEAVRDKHADTREIIHANGAAIGKPMFGYRITGAKHWFYLGKDQRHGHRVPRNAKGPRNTTSNGRSEPGAFVVSGASPPLRRYG
jgi:DNA invertase Pin-like site-specific DNA recombinase